MGVKGGGGGGGEKKGPVVLASTVIGIYIYFTTICCKTGVPENPLPDTPET